MITELIIEVAWGQVRYVIGTTKLQQRRSEKYYVYDGSTVIEGGWRHKWVDVPYMMEDDLTNDPPHA
jgi:hypothetical protein